MGWAMVSAVGMIAMNVSLPWTLAVLATVGLGLWIVVAFNRLVRARNLLREGWSGVDVQLKRRHSLVPNLLECVKGYSRHEQAVLERVAALRSQAAADETLARRRTDENALTDQLRGLFALAEAYPDLKASRSFLDLQTQLADIEDQIQMARRYYNGAARNYNILVESFPGNLVARAFGFARAEFFEIETATHRDAPKVEV